MKKKKITIKPFLNTYLDPVGSETGRGGTRNIFSLYYKITYDRKNTQLKSYYSLGYSSLEDSVARQIIAFETKILTSIIDYEISLHPDQDYQLSGLKKKYEVYVLSVYHVIDVYLRKKLQYAASKTNHPWHLVIDFKAPGIMINAIVLLELCKKIFKNFDKYIDTIFKEELESFKHYHQIFSDKLQEYDFATLIDWKNGTHVKKLETALKKHVKDAQKINKYVQTIDHILNERLKNIVDE
jgi:hypothetical protein